ncbi:unnamed protein product [Meloidogyne enterolobii]|uniref:Uncharacterized protein n=1 Tax=Meloidogyne enterolobii TaxID=390850 RepID=A0ACB0Y4J5_MELEN
MLKSFKEEVKIRLGIETQVLGQIKENKVDNEEFIKKRSDSGFTETSFLQSEYLKINENIFEEKGIIEELNIPIYLEENSKDFASNEILEKNLENIEEYFVPLKEEIKGEENNNFNLLQIYHPEESLQVSVMLLEQNQQLISPISERTIKIPEEKNKSSSSLDSVGINSEISKISSEEEKELKEQKQHSSPSLKILGFDAKVFESEKDFVFRIKAVVKNEPKKVIDSQIKVEEWLTKYVDVQLFEEDEINEKEGEELLTEKDESEILKKIMKSSRQSSITKEFSEVKEFPVISIKHELQKSKSEAEVSKLIKEQRKEEININTKTFREEFKNFQANLIGKEDWESYRKIIKSASQSSVISKIKEFGETRFDSSISFDQRPKNWEEFEIEIKQKRKLEEKISTKAVEDFKTQKEINFEKLFAQENTNLNMKEKLKEKSFLATKAPIYEKKDFIANLIGKEEWESARKITKSVSQSAINSKIKEFIETRSDSVISIDQRSKDSEEFGIEIKEKRKLNEKINTKSASDYKIKNEIILEKLNSEEKTDKKLKEKLQEKTFLSSKTSIHEKKEFSANFVGKEEWKSDRKIIKLASQSSIKFKGREFSEERASSSISVDQKPKDFEEFEIKIKKKRELEEKIKTKSAGDFKIGSQMIFEQLDKQEKTDLKLKEKLQEKSLLPSKAPIYEEKEFSANLIGKEEWKNAAKLQKSASLSSIISKIREFVETRSDSVISINQRPKDVEEFGIEIKEKRQLEEKINTKAVGDFKIESQMILEKLICEEKADKKLKEKLNEKTFLSFKASIKELKEFSANFVGKEEWESTRKIQKSKSLSSVTLKLKEFIESRASSVLFIEKPKEYLEESEIKLKEKYKIKEKLNTKEMGDLKIGQNIYFEQMSKPEIIGFTQKEKIKEKSILKYKPSTQEIKDFQANLHEKEEWESDRKIIKSASQSSIKFFGREFSEERASSSILINQKQTDFEEVEIKIKDKRPLEEKIKTKSAGDFKIEEGIVMEILPDEGISSSILKEKSNEKFKLSTKAPIYEEKESFNFFEKDKDFQNSRKTQNSSNSSSAFSIFSFSKKSEYSKQKEIKLLDKIKLKEKLNTQSSKNINIFKETIFYKKSNCEEKIFKLIKEKLKENIYLKLIYNLQQIILFGKEEKEEIKKLNKEKNKLKIKFKIKELEKVKIFSTIFIEKFPKIFGEIEEKIKEKSWLEKKINLKESEYSEINIQFIFENNEENIKNALIKINEKIKEKYLFSIKSTKNEFKELNINLTIKEDWGSITKLNKLKNKNLAELKIKEFNKIEVNAIINLIKNLNIFEEVEVNLKEINYLNGEKLKILNGKLEEKLVNVFLVKKDEEGKENFVFNLQKSQDYKLGKTIKLVSWEINKNILEKIEVITPHTIISRNLEIKEAIKKSTEINILNENLGDVKKEMVVVDFKKWVKEEGEYNVEGENQEMIEEGIEILNNLVIVQEYPKVEAEKCKIVLNNVIIEVKMSGGKKVNECCRKILKSPNQFSTKFIVKEFIEEKTSPIISSNLVIPEIFEESEFKIEEKQKVEEKIKVKSAGDIKIQKELVWEKLQDGEISSLNLKEKRDKKALLLTKAPIYEEKEFIVNLIGKTNLEEIQEIKKSKSQTNISFKSKEMNEEGLNSIIYIENKLKDKNEIEVIYSDKYKIQEKLNTQSAGDEKIISEKSLQKSKSEAEVFKLVKEQRKEEININTKTFKEEFKNFQANLIGKEDWESYRKIIKSASQSSVISKIKEFGETRFDSSISFDQRPKIWGEFEIEIKEKRKLEENITTKAVGDFKTQKEINFEKLFSQENTNLNLKEMLKEKSLLSTKAPIYEKKEFFANLILGEESESTRKIQKSASEINTSVKLKEFIENRFDSVISFNQNPKNSEKFEIEIKKRKLEEEINTKAVGDLKIESQIALERSNFEEEANMKLKEKLQEKTFISSKALIHKEKDFSANLIGKEEWESSKKIIKSASQSSIKFKSREFSEERANSVISFYHGQKDFEDSEIEIKEKVKLNEKINTKAIKDIKTQREIKFEKLFAEENTNLNMKEKLKEKSFLSAKAPIYEKKDFTVNLIGEEGWESTIELQKSASLSSVISKVREFVETRSDSVISIEQGPKDREEVEFRIKEERHLKEKININAFEDCKIEEKIVYKKPSTEEKASFNLKEKQEGKMNFNLRASNLSLDLLGKEEWENAGKIQKSASEINISIKLKEFIETKFDSIISFNQRPKDSGEFEIEIKEKRELDEKIKTKSAGNFKIESQIILEHPDSEEKIDMKLKEKLQEKTFLSSKASIKELKEFSANFVGKEEWENSKKIIKSASQSSIKFFGREFSEERAISSISIDQKQKDFEEFEINLKEKRQLKEVMNTQELQNNEIREGVFMEKLQNEGISSLILKEKRNEKDVLSTKVPIYEEEKVSTKLLGKEEMENIRKIQKSKNQTNISFEGREMIVYSDKYKIQEKLNTKTFGDVRIEEEKFLQKSKSEAEVSKLIKEQRKEEININTKTFKEEFKNFQANLIGKEDWESYRKIIKSASQSSVISKIKEFGETRSDSFISFDQRPKTWGEFEIEIKEKRKLAEKINTKAVGELKIESRIALEHPNFEGITDLNLKEKLQDKTFLSSKASIHEKKDFTANLIGKEEWESDRKIIKSASQSSIKFFGREFSEEGAISSISIDQKQKDFKEFEIKIKEKRKLEEKISTKSAGDFKTQNEINLEQSNDKKETSSSIKETPKEKSVLMIKETPKEKTCLSSKASIEEKKEFWLNFEGKQVLESTGKLQKSSSLSTIKFTTKETIEERASSIISLTHPTEYLKEIEIKFKENIKSVENIKIIQRQLNLNQKNEKGREIGKLFKEVCIDKISKKLKAPTFELKQSFINLSTSREALENAQNLIKSPNQNSTNFQSKEFGKEQTQLILQLNSVEKEKSAAEIKILDKIQEKQKAELICEETKNYKNKIGLINEINTIWNISLLKEGEETVGILIKASEKEKIEKVFIAPIKSVSSEIEEIGRENIFVEAEQRNEAEKILKEKIKIFEGKKLKEFGLEEATKTIGLTSKEKDFEEINTKLEEKNEEKVELKSKASIEDKRIIETTITGREEGEDANKIIKSASQSSIKFSGREFSEERAISSISIDQKQKYFEEIEIKIKEKRQLEERIKTKSAGDFKIEGQMIFEQLDVQEKADLKLKEKLQEKALLYSKASLHEEKEFSANLIGKEEWESTRKLQKSASLSSVIFKVREFVETRSDSVISINQRTRDSEELEFKIKEKRQLEEKINTKSVGDFKIERKITRKNLPFIKSLNPRNKRIFSQFCRKRGMGKY